jgi:hypothetical protein
LEIAFDLQYGKAGLGCDLAAGHTLGETKNDADAMDGLEAGAFGEKVV